MKNLSKKFGFSLIEIIIYIGLFSLLFSTVIIGAYQLMFSVSALGIASDKQADALFVLQKLTWLGADVQCTHDDVLHSLSCGNAIETASILSDEISTFDLVRSSTTTWVQFSIGSTTYQQTLYKNI